MLPCLLRRKLTFVSENLQGLARVDSLATIGRRGVVWETFLLIHSGSSRAPAATPLFVLPSKEPMDISNLLDQGQRRVSDVERVRQYCHLSDAAADNVRLLIYPG